jgi:hypothetical protein
MNIILFLFKVVVFKGRQGLETALNQGFIGKIKIKTNKTGRVKVNTSLVDFPKPPIKYLFIGPGQGS